MVLRELEEKLLENIFKKISKKNSIHVLRWNNHSLLVSTLGKSKRKKRFVKHFVCEQVHEIQVLC